MRVAPASRAAARGDDALAIVRRVLERKAALRIDHERAGWHLDDEGLAAAALTIRATTGRAACRPPEAVMRKRCEVVHAVSGDDDDAAALAAIAPVGTAMRDVLFAAEADAAVAAAASLGLNRDAIDEHGTRL